MTYNELYILKFLLFQAKKQLEIFRLASQEFIYRLLECNHIIWTEIISLRIPTIGGICGYNHPGFELLGPFLFKVNKI